MPSPDPQPLTAVLAYLEQARNKLEVTPVPEPRLFEGKMRVLKHLEEVITSVKSLLAQMANVPPDRTP